MWHNFACERREEKTLLSICSLKYAKWGARRRIRFTHMRRVFFRGICEAFVLIDYVAWAGGWFVHLSSDTWFRNAHIRSCKSLRSKMKKMQNLEVTQSIFFWRLSLSPRNTMWYRCRLARWVIDLTNLSLLFFLRIICESFRDAFDYDCDCDAAWKESENGKFRNANFG